MHKAPFLAGAAAAVAARAALPHLVKAKLDRDVARLGRGDHRPLLAGYAEDAVLHFHEGAHRWAGTYRGKAEIEVFLKSFVAAGLTGEIRRVWLSGPPWAMEMCVRFDDVARSPDGEELYSNRTVLWVRTRWGRIVEQRDFYQDTQRILDLDARLTELTATTDMGTTLSDRA